MVSPGFGNRSANVVKSMLALPTTATRGGMIYSQESCDRRVYLAPLANVNLDSGKQLLAVRNPDVLHLGCVLQIPPAFASLGVKPIDGAPLVSEYLFQIPHGERFRFHSVGLVRKT